MWSHSQTENRLQIGNLVRLRSGGPSMTVERAGDGWAPFGLTDVVWISRNGELRRASIMHDLLELMSNE